MTKAGKDETGQREKRSTSRCTYNTKENKDMFIILLVLIVCVIIGAITIAFSECENAPIKKPYKNAAVATDATPCSKVGRDILMEGGSAVDAAVATQFCLSVVIPHSTGIGGGGFMVLYNKTSHTSEVYDFREVAPAAATRDMFVNETVEGVVGGHSIAVPGMVRGLYAAWQKHGVLMWKDLITPAVEFARGGVNINKALNQAIKEEENIIKNNPGLKKLFMKGNELKEEGDTFKQPKLATTLENIADDPESFYDGDLAKKIVQDIKSANGLVSSEDLRKYKVNKTGPVSNQVGDFTMVTPPPPSSGIVMAMILNILNGYNLKPEDLEDEDKAPLTYHRFVEAFKFAYARRGLLGDPAFMHSVDKVMDELLNHSIADQLRERISDSKTHTNESYYGGFYAKSSGGTSHTSIISEQGDAVSVTSTINYWFGSGILSEETGILYNNEMDDFSTPGQSNAYGYPPSHFNFIEPGKRPMSSMSPVIVVDKNGDVRLVAGATGGSRIITGTAQVIMNNLWFAMNAWNAVVEPRLHHQLLPPYVQIDADPYNMAEYILEGLRDRGHKIREIEGEYLSCVQAVTKENNLLYAKSDPRKFAEAAGY